MRTEEDERARESSRWLPSLRAAAGLTAAMGIGRFAFTPLLPVMIQQAGLTAVDAAVVATANYVGYLFGAVMLAVRPRWNSGSAFRAAALVLVASQLAIPLTTSVVAWSALRLVAGVASAVVFIACSTTVVRAHRRDAASPGVAYSGVGTGIAVSGLVVAVTQHWLSWQQLWLVAGALTLVFMVIAWPLRVESDLHTAPARTVPTAEPPVSRTPWHLLLGVYFLEGVGYIIVGTFLVAAFADSGSSSLGPAAWAIVGLAAAPSPILWARIRIPSGVLLVTALVLQTAGALLPGLLTGTVAAVASAALFGGTFMAITMLSMLSGASLGIGQSAAKLTATYGLGQVLGPLVVIPLLSRSYQPAFLVAAAVLAVSTLAAVAFQRSSGRPVRTAA